MSNGWLKRLNKELLQLNAQSLPGIRVVGQESDMKV
jgi:hypothetical protein